MSTELQKAGDDYQINRDFAVKLAEWRMDPVQFALEELAFVPDPWQADVLNVFPVVRRLAMIACTGPGKSAILAVLCWNFLATRKDAKIAITSITGDNLKDGLWAELGKWYKRSRWLRDTFVYGAERIWRRAGDPESSFISARQWTRGADAEQLETTLAGLHEDACMIVVDEAGGVPAAVLATADNVLSSGDDTKVIIAGNPTHTEGPLWDAAGEDRDIWEVFQITGDPADPNRAPRVRKDWALEQIRKNGRTSPWVQIRVMGKFPTTSTESVVPMQQILDAFERAKDYEDEPLARDKRTLGVDVARKGKNKTVITYRTGDYVDKMEEFSGLKIEETAHEVKLAIKAHDPAETRIDDNGVGGDVSDLLEADELEIVRVNACATAEDPEFHINVRSEMAAHVQERFRLGRISLPESVRETTLLRECTTIRIEFNSTARRRLEDKDKYIKRVGISPDHYDSLALAFADGAIIQGEGVAGEEEELRRGALAGGRPAPHEDDAEAGEWASRPRTFGIGLRRTG